jgi:hypothetical protein
LAKENIRGKGSLGWCCLIWWKAVLLLFMFLIFEFRLFLLLFLFLF